MKHKYYLMTKEQQEILVECYEKHSGNIDPDYLAYTKEFDEIVKDFRKKSATVHAQHVVWCNLIRLRERGGVVLKSCG